MCTAEEGHSIPDDFLCPITQTIMEDPLMTRDGFSFEREAILQWISVDESCPFTRRPLSSSQLVTNNALKNRIRNWRIMQENKNDLPDATVANSSSDRLAQIKRMVQLARQQIHAPMADLVSV